MYITLLMSSCDHTQLMSYSSYDTVDPQLSE